MVQASTARTSANSAAAAAATNGAHRWVHVPECLKVAASEGNVLSMSTLHQAVAALEKQPRAAVTSAHVESLLHKVKGTPSFCFLYTVFFMDNRNIEMAKGQLFHYCFHSISCIEWKCGRSQLQLTKPNQFAVATDRSARAGT